MTKRTVPPLAGLGIARSIPGSEATSPTLNSQEKATSAILLSWKDDHAFIRKHVDDMQTVMQNMYGFDVECVDVPYDSSQAFLQGRLLQITNKYPDNRRHLIIVYYIGKAWISDELFYWAPSLVSANREGPHIEWLSLQTDLQNAHPDILIMLDCDCDIGECLQRDEEGQPQSGEFQYAINAGKTEVLTTHPLINQADRGSFTQAVLKVLRLWSEKKSFFAYQLKDYLVEKHLGHRPKFYVLSQPTQSPLEISIKTTASKPNHMEMDVPTALRGPSRVLTPQLVQLRDPSYKFDDGVNMVAWELDTSKMNQRSGESALSLVPEQSDIYDPAGDEDQGGMEAVYNKFKRTRVDASRFGPTGEYRAICKLFMEFERVPGKRQVGTGWLIDEKTVVTAAHCAYQRDVRHAVSITVHVGYRGRQNEDTLVSTGGKHVAINLGYYVFEQQGEDKRRRPYDVAFIRLAEPFHGVKPVPWADCPLQADDIRVRVVGYPTDLDGGDHMYESECQTTIDLQQSKFMLEYGLDTFKGNSGGPVLKINSDGTFEAIGVHCYCKREELKNQASCIGQRENIFKAFILGLQRINGEKHVAWIDAQQLQGNISSLMWVKVPNDQLETA